MTFTLFRTSDFDSQEIVEINTLNDLIDLQKKYCYALIFNVSPCNIAERTGGRYIEIYDTYGE